MTEIVSVGKGKFADRGNPSGEGRGQNYISPLPQPAIYDGAHFAETDGAVKDALGAERPDDALDTSERGEYSLWLSKLPNPGNNDCMHFRQQRQQLVNVAITLSASIESVYRFPSRLAVDALRQHSRQ